MPPGEDIAEELVAHSGCVRGSEFVIELSIPRSIPEPSIVAIEFHFHPTGSERLNLSDLPRSQQAESTIQLHAKIPQRPVKSVEIAVPLRPETRVAYGPGYELLNLFPKSPEGEMPLVFARKHRIKDTQTLCFMAQQLIAGPDTPELLRTEAVKVLCYRSIEDLDTPAMQRSLAFLDARLAWLSSLQDSNGASPEIKGTSKFHPRHIQVSLLFIRVLHGLLLARHAQVATDMATLFDLRDSVASAPIIAFNLTQALLLNAWALYSGGRKKEADAQFTEIIKIFRSAAQHMPAGKAKMFAELSMSLTAAIFASSCRTEIRVGRPLQGHFGAEKVAERFGRVSSKGAQAALAVALTEFAAFYSRQP